MRRTFWDFKVQTDHLISARRPELVIVNKKIEPSELWNLLVKLKESEKRELEHRPC